MIFLSGAHHKNLNKQIKENTVSIASHMSSPADPEPWGRSQLYLTTRLWLWLLMSDMIQQRISFLMRKSFIHNYISYHVKNLDNHVHLLLVVLFQTFHSHLDIMTHSRGFVIFRMKYVVFDYIDNFSVHLNITKQVFLICMLW